jgi:hypothetical protein
VELSVCCGDEPIISFGSRNQATRLDWMDSIEFL